MHHRQQLFSKPLHLPLVLPNRLRPVRLFPAWIHCALAWGLLSIRPSINFPPSAAHLFYLFIKNEYLT